MINKSQFVKNNLLVFSNKIISKVITFGIIVVLTRHLSANDFGSLTILITMSSVFSAFQDLGSSFIVVRETAMNHQSSRKILITTLFLKTISGIICYLTMLLFVYLMGYSETVIRLSYIFAAGMLVESFLLTLIKHFEGKEEMKYSSTIIIAERILIALFVFLLSMRMSALDSYGLAYFLSNSIVFVTGLFFAVKSLNIFIFLDFKLFKKIVLALGIFIVFVFFSTIYTRIDIFLISYFLDEVKVATYRACYQIIEAIYFIPLNLSVSLLPFFSRQFVDDPEKLKHIYFQVIRQVVKISLFISITLIIGSSLILNILYNKYGEGQLVFSILSASIPFYFANSINGNLLIAVGKEKKVTIALFVGFAAKFVIMLLVIIVGIEGAAISALVAETIVCVLQYMAIYKFGFKIKIQKEDIADLLLIITYAFSIYFAGNYVVLIVLASFMGIWLSKNILFFIKQNIFAGR